MSKVEAVIIETNPQRPTDYNEAALLAVLEDAYLIADKKEDGVRLNLCVSPSVAFTGAFNTEWLSREGKRFPRLNSAARKGPLCRDGRWKDFFSPYQPVQGLFPQGFMLDAELIVKNEFGADMACKETSGVLRRDRDTHGELPVEKLKVVVFGVVPMDAVLSGKDYEVTHAVMKYHVEAQVAALKYTFPEIHWEVVESLDVFSLEELHQFNHKVRDSGGEGVVAKDPNGIWKRSKVNGMWKIVPKDNEDGKVVGLVWGTEGKANEGKVIGFEVLLESGHVVNACKITQAQMDEFTAEVMLTHDPRSKAEPHNPYEGWTCKVTFMERYENGSLRHPSFDSFRGISDPKIKE
ncbi:ATP-dependent DNA ligase [Pseudomonas sp. GXZC]|uniref:ATP-dependent DNA ligase n=1 Tax=Pseudomonas sp. GXZC TaxID=3003351 RepID=UPI0022AA1576|nr:hypothetical protein [Pseudomonas sp. GXZC]WAT31152.1 hypothetical protein OZ428_12705 [Pseudomonas sp. GXZC]